ncbi:MAG: hypothetical protein ABIA74_04305 [bacterium]
MKFFLKKFFILFFSFSILINCFAPALEQDYGFGIIEAIRNNLPGENDILKVSSRKPLKIKGKRTYLRQLEIKPKETIEFEDIEVLDSGLTVKGFYTQDIPQFPSGSMLILNPLRGAGFAWMGKSIDVPNKTAVYARIKAGDKGGAIIAFSNKASFDFQYKVVLGSANNTESVIIKKDKKRNKEQILLRVIKDENTFAALRPGRFDEYWVSFNDGMIIVGRGVIGENPFMSVFDPDFYTDVNRIGFGSSDTEVNFVDIQTTLPVIAQTIWQPYFSEAGPLKLEEKSGRYKISPKPLRVPGRGCFSFEAKGTAISVALGDNMEYELLIGVDANSRTVLKREGKVVTSILADACKDIVITSPDEFYKYWISIYNGEILFGKGDVGKNLLLVYKDGKPLDVSNTLNLGSIAASGKYAIDGKVEFKDVKIGPSVDLTLDVQQDYYKKEKNLFRFSDSFVVVSPLEYEIFQTGQQVGVKDLIIGPTYFLQKVPQQGAKYFFMLIINPDGSPDLVWIKGPEESKLKVTLSKAAYITRATADALTASAQATSLASGPGKGGLIGGVASVGMGLAAIGGSVAAAGMEFDLSRYRGDDSYVFMEAGNKEAMANLAIPESAKVNRQIVLSRVQEALLEKDPATLAVMYQDIIDLINHFYVVEDIEGSKTSYVKKKIFDALERLYNERYKQQSIEYYLSLLNLLTDARDNPYLTDVSDSVEKNLKDQWYVWSNEIARELFDARNKTQAGVSIPPSYGEYFWVKDAFEKEGEGSVTFEAKALSDIFVCFGQQPFKTRNAQNQIYEIVIGAWDNDKTVLRVSSLGKTVKEYKKSEYPDAVADPLEFKKYWMSIKDGEITMGTGDLDPKNTLLKWKDPYPIKRVRYVGFSSWNSKVDVRNIEVHNYSVYDVPKVKTEVKAKTVEKLKPIAEKPEESKIKIEEKTQAAKLPKKENNIKIKEEDIKIEEIPVEA